MACSLASTRSSQSWIAPNSFGTKASSLSSSILAINLFPSISDKISDSIFALFAGREAKLRLERKRMLAHFRSLPNPAQQDYIVYENGLPWYAGTGRVHIGHKLVDGIVYRYHVSPEQSLGESCISSYVATDHICQLNRLGLEIYQADRRPSPSAFQTCEPCYDPPARSQTPEPFEERRYWRTPDFKFPKWTIDLDYEKCWYSPTPPVPPARDISNVDYKLPCNVPRLKVPIERPQKNQQHLKSGTQTSTLVTTVNIPVFSAGNIARQKTIIDFPESSLLAYTIPPQYQLRAHMSCFPSAALPRRDRFSSCGHRLPTKVAKHMENEKNDKSAEIKVTDHIHLVHSTSSFGNNVITASIMDDYKNVTAYYDVDKGGCSLNLSWFSYRAKSAKDWKLLAEYVERVQNSGYRDAMYSNLHNEYKLASQYLEQLELEKHPSHLVSLRYFIHETKRHKLQTAQVALRQADSRKPWEFCASHNYGYNPTRTNDTENEITQNESCIEESPTFCKAKDESNNLAKVRRPQEKVKARPKTTMGGRPASSRNIKNGQAITKSNSEGGYTMDRKRKRRAVDGRDGKVTTTLAISPRPIPLRDKPHPEVPEHAIANTDSEDDWDPKCFIEPIKKPNRPR